MSAIAQHCERLPTLGQRVANIRVYTPKDKRDPSLRSGIKHHAECGSYRSEGRRICKWALRPCHFCKCALWLRSFLVPGEQDVWPVVEQTQSKGVVFRPAGTPFKPCFEWFKPVVLLDGHKAYHNHDILSHTPKTNAFSPLGRCTLQVLITAAAGPKLPVAPELGGSVRNSLLREPGWLWTRSRDWPEPSLIELAEVLKFS